MAILGKALEAAPNLRFWRGGERSQGAQLPWSRKKDELEESLRGDPPPQEIGLYKDSPVLLAMLLCAKWKRRSLPRRKYWGHEDLLMAARGPLSAKGSLASQRSPGGCQETHLHRDTISCSTSWNWSSERSKQCFKGLSILGQTYSAHFFLAVADAQRAEKVRGQSSPASLATHPHIC